MLKGWRQVDLEAASGVDQSSISLIERGRLDRFTVHTVRLVGDAVGVPLELWARMPAADVQTLLDEGHAGVVERVLSALRGCGWETIAEYTFSHYGERGSVDIVAWHEPSRTLLIVEVKTLLLDIQELISTLDRKSRLVPRLLSAERGWRAEAVGRLLVVEEGTTARRVVARHRTTFATTFPARNRAAQSWIRGPDGPLSGLWFLSPTNGVRDNRRPAVVQRVRRPNGSRDERG